MGSVMMCSGPQIEKPNFTHGCVVSEFLTAPMWPDGKVWATLCSPGPAILQLYQRVRPMYCKQVMKFLDGFGLSFGFVVWLGIVFWRLD